MNIEKGKGSSPCIIVKVTSFAKGEVGEIKQHWEMLRLGNPLRFRHTFAKQKMNESRGREKYLSTLLIQPPQGGWND
ncbi:hypothetical protein [Vibrio fluminensis]|uniref:hypothetical protein n=1 Tax=Vibrio fluminensis TaxID=2783614 RepID=UPI001888C5D4|nr:hypothetical protein [Vibrio fluminensis]